MGNIGQVLIVEDDTELVSLLSVLLQDEGFETRHALGEPALKIAEEIQPDVILLDLMMPGMDGLEWSNRAKANPRICNIPIIVLSAAAPVVILNNYKDVQAMSYIPKPFDIDQVINLVFTFKSLQNYGDQTNSYYAF